MPARESGDQPALLALARMAIGIVWRAAPRWAIANVALTLIQGIFPLASLMVVKHLIDAVVTGARTPHPLQAWPHILWYILAIAAITLLSGACRTLSEVVSERLSFRVTESITEAAHAHLITIDLATHEDARFKDIFHRALLDAPSRPSRMLQNLLQLVQQGVTLVGLVGLLLSANGLLTVMLALAALPGAWVRWRHAKQLEAMQRETTEMQRRSSYLNWLLSDARLAKEVRLFGFGSLLAERYQTLRETWRAMRERITLHRARVDLLLQAVVAVALAAALMVVVRQSLLGALTAGMLVMVLQGTMSTLNSLQSLIRSAVGLGEDALFLANYDEFLRLRPQIACPAAPRPVPPPGVAGIRMQGVSFSYPGQGRRALDAVDLQLPTGQIAAIVGENGSGKTTLIKLLSRLYAPDAGCITVEGVELGELDPEAWRREISAVFQDYGCYAMTAAENIRLGDVHAVPEHAHIREAAVRAGVDSRLTALPQGYDSELGRMFSGGQELSVGEWQRVALARALLRPSRLLILDEPTSALDALAEEAFFKLIRAEAGTRSVLLISHRFSTVRLADAIYVLERGRVVQQGTHEELLRQGGRYAEAFYSQARGYDRVETPV